MILVDTSVWIEHLRNENDRLKILLFEEQVVCHPFVIGELACGTLQKREQILSLLTALPEVELLEHEEVMSFIQGRRIWSRYWLGGRPSARFNAAHGVFFGPSISLSAEQRRP